MYLSLRIIRLLGWLAGSAYPKRPARNGVRESSVAPVEVARAAPERVFVGGRLRLRREAQVLGRDGLGSVHRLLDPGLLFGLEQGVVLEGVGARVLVQRHVLVELRVAALQLEMFLDYVRKDGRRLYRHKTSLVGRSLLTGRRGMIAGSFERSEASRWGGRVG